MINTLSLRRNVHAVAVASMLAFVGAFQVGCTSCLVTPRPAPAQRLEEEARDAGTPTTTPPLACPAFGSSGVPRTLPAKGGHRVILSWRASAPADSKHAAAVGYCIYRSVIPNDPSPVLLNSTPFASTSCADDLVENGKQYYYVVRAIDANRITSIVSNEAPARIPKRSNPAVSQASPPLCRGPASMK
jgi:hypothetical protein